MNVVFVAVVTALANPHKGLWVLGVTYQVGNIVVYNGNAYICIRETSSRVPGSAPNYWETYGNPPP